MVVSGITAKQEFCLSVEEGNSATDGAAVVLETCAGAVAAGDGRELFSLQAGGQILNVAGGKCLGVDGDSDGSEVVLSGCDKASQWEVLGNGQLRLNAPGDLCLAQAGLAPGSADVAVNAAVMASSTVNSLSHGAAMAVDDDADTYWASKFDDTKAPVEYVIDFGDAQKLQSIELSWEFPARAFAVASSVDGEHFTDVFATDANVLKSSRVSLGGVLARKLRISMFEPHPTYARFQGHLLYGIRSVAVFADRLRSVVSECAKVAKSSDARDKFFLSYVGEFDPFPAKGLRSELPAVEAARASLAATVSELADAVPQLSLCHSESMPSIRATATRSAGQSLRALAVQTGGARSGLAADELESLLAEARSSIVGVRKVLA